jgi:hypothetical protein
MDPGPSLIAGFDHVWHRLGRRLAGLTDDEYLWEPVPKCWTLRPGTDGRWQLDGGGGGGPAPDPVPVTTIAWRIGHLAGMAVGGFADRLVATGSSTSAGVDFPKTAAGVDAFLATNYARWRAGLIGVSEPDWGRPLGRKWGPYADTSTCDLVLHVFDEVVHHGAEIGVLRDLYAQRGSGPSR